MPKSGKTIAKRADIAEGLAEKRLADAELAEELRAMAEDLAARDDPESYDFERCDFCSRSTHLCGELVGTRDPDEGMNGPTYRVCQRCYGKQQHALQVEYDRLCLDLAEGW